MTWKGKKVLVTGGSGFLGTHLVDELLQRGADVTVFDIVQLEKTHENFHFVNCDISKKPAFPGDLNVIFHLAALAYPKSCEDNPALAFDTNVTGTLNMLLLAKEKNVQKFVFPSSAQLYGRYPRYLPVDEKHPIEYADNFYTTTKKFGEDLCMTFYEKHGLPVIFFRLFNAFGPAQAKDYLIPTIILQALEKGAIELWNEKPTRDFTFVSDTVRAFLLAAETKYCGGPINIGSSVETNVGDIARHIAQVLNVDIRFLNKEVIGSMQLCCDNSMAKNILGWKPEIPFKEGLNRTIKWFKEEIERK